MRTRYVVGLQLKIQTSQLHSNFEREVRRPTDKGYLALDSNSDMQPGVTAICYAIVAESVWSTLQTWFVLLPRH